jgi:hypothetical protein
MASKNSHLPLNSIFFYPLSVHIRYLVVKLSQVQVFIAALRFSPVSFHQSSIITRVIQFNTTVFRKDMRAKSGNLQTKQCSSHMAERLR